MIIYDMKTEDLINPIGIDEKKPRFSWKLQSKISGTLSLAQFAQLSNIIGAAK